jgi:hypothetical protein
VATKPSRLWAAVQQKLHQLAMVADVSGFDYLRERVRHLEQEVSGLRTEIGAGQPLHNSDRVESQSSEV